MIVLCPPANGSSNGIASEAPDALYCLLNDVNGFIVDEQISIHLILWQEANWKTFVRILNYGIGAYVFTQCFCHSLVSYSFIHHSLLDDHLGQITARHLLFHVHSHLAS
ncbi:uncharacterized protein MELLADRAFT_71602 [Melampsora larici-populina 98AG31]|uniref:Uncharacterized protein n=1 Tax=Melampsora larici-populina (strain 98AG31 / pathotype 3-4-7) TaxID=747676 RepID=F4RIC0_MELLP|nr:uncharacterized protein MELLADRAFT_71602 [Melampsora larici-populina 98AG31]EGG07979.1 hypothetical protein MELLADRAFT_71602 [Melampsora larici-populina 98AG31]